MNILVQRIDEYHYQGSVDSTILTLRTIIGATSMPVSESNLRQLECFIVWYLWHILRCHCLQSWLRNKKARLSSVALVRMMVRDLPLAHLTLQVVVCFWWYAWSNNRTRWWGSSVISKDGKSSFTNLFAETPNGGGQHQRLQRLL